jgi:hypothetical protein
MSALQAPFMGSVKDVDKDLRPLAAGAKVYENGIAIGIISSTSAGYVKQGDNTSVAVAIGRFMENADNTSGADGDVAVNVEFFRTRKLALFDNDSGTPVSVAMREGPCYVLDDHTVSGAVSDAFAGTVYDVTPEGVWVELNQAAALSSGDAAGLSNVAPVDPSTTAAAAGVATLAARQDHKHHIANATTGASGLESAADKTLLGHLSTHTVKLWEKPAADGSAAATTAEHVIYEFDGNTAFSAMHIVPDASLTHDGTNYGSIVLELRDGAGGAPSTVATLATVAGDWTAWEAVSMGALTGVGTAPAAGSILTVKITKTATGEIIPALSLFGVPAIA